MLLVHASEMESDCILSNTVHDAYVKTGCIHDTIHVVDIDIYIKESNLPCLFMISWYYYY